MRTHYAAPKLKHFGNLGLVVAGFIGVGVAMAIPETPTYHREVLYLGAFMMFLVYGIWKYLKMPYRITVTSDARITFRSLLGEATVAPAEVTDIATESFGYYVHFETRKGKYVILNGVDGLHELISWMRERNPSLRVRGL
jgi:hypothetical protein